MIRTLNQLTSLMLLAAAGPAAAQAVDATNVASSATETAASQSMTVQQILEYGGWLMYPLVILSIIGLAMIIYFLFILREEQVLPKKFVSGVRELLHAGRFAEAQQACRSNDSPIAAILHVALDYVVSREKADGVLMRELMEGEGSRQATLIQNQTQYLVDISAVAPMIGLLGTVVGMLKAFNVVALDLAKAKPMLLAGGVSQALITTVAGLIVAIPATMAYAYFRGRSAKLISSLEATTAEFAVLIAGKTST